MSTSPCAPVAAGAISRMMAIVISTKTFFHFYSTAQHNVAALKSKISSERDGCLAKQQQVQKIVFVTS